MIDFERTRPSRLPRPLKIATGVCLAFFALYFGAGFLYDILAAHNRPAPQHIDEVRNLDQGWGPNFTSPDRQTYYYTPQGTQMHGVRYRWFVQLEVPFHHQRFVDPDHMRAMNFIVDPSPTAANPDLLPVGFAQRYDDRLRDNVVDITCSACHTGQLHVTRNNRTTAIRIDGGQAMTAFTDANAGSFQVDLLLALTETMLNPLKFNRFADKVLEPGVDTLHNKFLLWQDLSSVVGNLLQLALHGSSSIKLYPVQEGYGRTDALARIGNVVFGDHVSKKNFHTGNGPVNYPYLWNIWKFNWEQYGASVSQPMARNGGEALGVGADLNLVDDYGRPVAKDGRYRTSVSFDNLLRIESTIQKLQPPQWPEDLLGKINRPAADRGEKLFNLYCVRCHGPYVASAAMTHATSPGRLPGDPMWLIEPVKASVIGTDPLTADNFVRDSSDLTASGITLDEVTPLLRQEYKQQQKRIAELVPALQAQIAKNKDPHDAYELKYELNWAQQNPISDAFIDQQIKALDLAHLNNGQALNLLGMLIRQRYYQDRHMSKEAQACFAGFDTLDLPQIVDGYKARPLAGVWATPPFLHNGSVPNLYELLSPLRERSSRFFVGRLDFDPVRVGYRTEPAQGSSGGFWFDTSVPGNRNTGHEFRADFNPKAPNAIPGVVGPELMPDERIEIIEYLKVRADNPPEAIDRQPIDCFALLK